MATVSLVFALFTVGYILGVWTACLVFRQPQRAYEEGSKACAADREMVPILASRVAPRP